MGSELPSKVGERIEVVGVVESLLVFPVAAFDLAVVSGRVRADQLVADTQEELEQQEENLVVKLRQKLHKKEKGGDEHEE